VGKIANDDLVTVFNEGTEEWDSYDLDNFVNDRDTVDWNEILRDISADTGGEKNERGNTQKYFGFAGGQNIREFCNGE